MRISAVLAATAVAVLASASTRAPAQVRETPRGWLFRASFKPGTVLSYRLDGASEGHPKPETHVSNWSLYNLACKRLENGKAVVHYELVQDEEGKYKDIHLVLKIDRRGKAMWGNQPMQRLGVHFPENPIPIGGSFRGEAIVQMGGLGQAKATDTYTLLGFKDRAGVRVAELSVQSTARSEAVRAGGSGTVLIDMTDGSMVEMDYTHSADVTHDGKTYSLRQTATCRRTGRT